MPLKVSICTPIPNEQGTQGPRRGRPTFEWLKARMDLLTPLTTTVRTLWELGKTVDDARNDAAQSAIDNGDDFLFFLDWDTIPHPETLHSLVNLALDSPAYDVFSGVYCCRHRDRPAPLLYAGSDFKLTMDWTVGELLASDHDGITGFGLGLCLIRVSLFKRLPAPWFVTSQGETEDLFFLRRARLEAGARFLVDTTFQAWHIDPETGIASNLPFDSGPVKRWRAAHPELPPTAVPYDVGQVSRMQIGQRMSGASDTATGEAK